MKRIVPVLITKYDLSHRDLITGHDLKKINPPGTCNRISKFYFICIFEFYLDSPISFYNQNQKSFYKFTRDDHHHNRFLSLFKLCIQKSTIM